MLKSHVSIILSDLKKVTECLDTEIINTLQDQVGSQRLSKSIGSHTFELKSSSPLSFGPKFDNTYRCMVQSEERSLAIKKLISNIETQMQNSEYFIEKDTASVS